MKKLLLIVFSIVLLGAACTQDSITFDNKSNPPMNNEPIGTPIDPKTLLFNEQNPDEPLAPGQKILVQDFKILANPDSKKGPRVTLKTNQGDIVLQLFQEAAPITVRNFLQLAELNYYDGTQFHRVIKDFMIQGGDPLTREQPENFSVHGTGGPDYKFEDEKNNHKNVRGRISMANSGPNTNGSQFFLITKDATPWLDGKHTVFGEVVEGMEVVDKIEATETNENDHPLSAMTILDVILEK